MKVVRRARWDRRTQTSNGGNRGLRVVKGHILQLVRYVPDGSLCTASAEQIFPRDSVQRNCFELALYTTRDHDCISNRIGSGIRTCPRCGCRLATFGALPTPSTIYRDIIMLNYHRFWGHASGPSSSSGKTLSSFHPLLARPCRSALPRERFRSLASLRLADSIERCPLSGAESPCAEKGAAARSAVPLL